MKPFFSTIAFLSTLTVVVVLADCQPQPIIVMVPTAGSASAMPVVAGNQPPTATQSLDFFLKIQQVLCNGDPLPDCIAKYKTVIESLTPKKPGGSPLGTPGGVDGGAR